jgi:hypothetical protein
VKLSLYIYIFVINFCFLHLLYQLIAFIESPRFYKALISIGCLQIVFSYCLVLGRYT